MVQNKKEEEGRKFASSYKVHLDPQTTQQVSGEKAFSTEVENIQVNSEEDYNDFAAPKGLSDDQETPL